MTMLLLRWINHFSDFTFLRITKYEMLSISYSIGIFDMPVFGRLRPIAQPNPKGHLSGHLMSRTNGGKVEIISSSQFSQEQLIRGELKVNF